jgi:hypothetical protein
MLRQHLATLSGTRWRAGPRHLAFTQTMEVGNISQPGIRLLPEKTQSRARTGHRPGSLTEFRPGLPGGD